MKKFNLFLVLTLITLFISIKNVNAATLEIIDNCTNMENGMGTICRPVVIVEGDNYPANKIHFNFRMTGVTFDVKNVSLKSEFSIVSSTDSTLTLKYSKNYFAPGRYEIGTISFYKIVSASVCNIYYSYRLYSENRNCYPTKKGEVPTDGKYYDKNGNETTKLEHDKQCFNYYCETITDGTTTIYYGKESNEIDKATFDTICVDDKTCIPKTKGEVPTDGKYYDKNGNETTKLEHDKQCLNHYCETITDGTTTIYYNDKGNEVNETTYKKECFTCRKEGEKYYDKEGNETTKFNYDRQCSKHFCETITDGTTTIYYNNNAEEVSEDVYKLICLKCRIDGDTYYDNNGNKIDETTYNLQCKTHKCEVIGDTYFDSKGNIVNKEDYMKSCDNPQTGNENKISYVAILIGIASAGLLLYISKKYTKLERI